LFRASISNYIYLYAILEGKELVRGNKKDIPEGLWVKCGECGEIIYNGELTRNVRICPKCGYYFPLAPIERINLLVDKGTSICLKDNISKCPEDENCQQIALTSRAKISGYDLVIGSVNLDFVRSGMEPSDVGLFVCEKIIRAIDHAIEEKLPLLLICSNSNGSNLPNNVFFPSQIASTSAAISRLNKEKLLYISVLAHSKLQGGFPGFAYIADISIAESKNPVVISPACDMSEKTKPDQIAFRSGMVDMAVTRGELKKTITDILRFFC
jgi:acetyl-CoA carboxylase carboxyl transferase subunit beta